MARVRLQATLTAAVLACAVGAALAGAGGASESGVPQASGRILALIARAPATLASYPSIKMTFDIDLDINGQHVSIDENGLTRSDGRGGTLSMTLPRGLGTFTAIVVGRTVYARVAAVKLPLTGGRHWAAVTFTGGQTQPATGSDALAYLRLLAGANGTIRVRGHDTIEGAPCTHYMVDVDVAKAAAAAPSQFGDTTQQLVQAGVTTLPVDVWLDAQGKPRKMKISYHLDGASFSMTIKAQGSNTPVNVTAPRASDVDAVGTFAELAPLVLN
jgi:hypothetical protein